MPNNDQCLEDLSWIAKEINDQGGEAIILSANLLEGLTDEQLIIYNSSVKMPSSSLGQFMVHSGASQKKRNRLSSFYLFMI